MTTRARVLDFDVSVGRDRTVSSDRGGSVLRKDDAWSAEHILLAALVRCTLTSLDYHVRRAGLTAAGSGTAHGTVTKRESDGRYAFVDIEARFELDVDDIESERICDVIERAERGCFVGNSLTATPRYHWTVNGKGVE